MLVELIIQTQVVMCHGWEAQVKQIESGDEREIQGMLIDEIQH
jgi:hypothetical protein